jgi:hypothetical protein
MAQTGYDRPQPGDPTHNISAQDARQGRNVKGMIWVLVISIALVVGAYAVMLALQAEPVTVDNRAVEDVAPAASTAAPAPTAETAQSPS